MWLYSISFKNIITSCKCSFFIEQLFSSFLLIVQTSTHELAHTHTLTHAHTHTHMHMRGHTHTNTHTHTQTHRHSRFMRRSLRSPKNDQNIHRNKNKMISYEHFLKLGLKCP